MGWAVGWAVRVSVSFDVSSLLFSSPFPHTFCFIFLLTFFTNRVGVVGDPGTTAVTGALTSARVAEAVAR